MAEITDEDMDESTYQEVNSFHCKSTPLFELSHICIQGPFPDGVLSNLDYPPADLYYRIQFLDIDDVQMLLSEQNCRLSEKIFNDDNSRLLIIGKSESLSPLWLTNFKLKLYVEYIHENVVIVDDEFVLDFSAEIVYDKEQCLHFDSQEYGVNVHYTIFKHAIIASVDCTLENTDSVGREGEIPSVEGTISATFKVRDKSISRIIPTVAPLSWTSCFAVSAYSPLRIFVDLVVAGERIESDKEGLEFIPVNSIIPSELEILGKKWRTVVTVKCNHGYDSLCQLCECFLEEGSRIDSVDFREGEESSNEGSEDEDMYKRNLKRLRVTVVRPVMSTQMLDSLPSALGPQLMEIFSISACTFVDNSDKLDDPILLHGFIECYDAFDKYVIFNTDKVSPSTAFLRPHEILSDTNKVSSVFLRPHDILSLVEPDHCYTGTKLGVYVDLKDNDSREIIRGGFDWDFNVVVPWYDRRLCSVIAGKNGFATVHYTIFKHSVQARLVVSFASRDDYACQVHGHIHARYTGYRYSTYYDKKYYTSKLFAKRKSESIEIYNDDYLPLSKSTVAVPLDECLILIFDLRIIHAGKMEKLKGLVTFKAEDRWTPKIHSALQTIGLGDLNFGFKVFIVWG